MKTNMLIAINYHYIRKEFNFQYPSIFGITPDAFKAQLLELKKFGDFVSQDDILRHIKGDQKLPSKSFIITFDDGLSEQFDLAVPVLEELGIPAIFYVNSQIVAEPVVLKVHKIHLLRSKISPAILSQRVFDFLKLKDANNYYDTGAKTKGIEHYRYDEPNVAVLKYLLNFVLTTEESDEFVNKAFSETFDSEEVIHNQLYMTHDQIKALAADNMIGCHGHSHLPIGILPKEMGEFEVSGAQQILRNITGGQLESFSYPYGSFDSCNGMASVLNSAGFKFAFSMERAVNVDLKKSLYLSRFDNNDMPLGKAWKGGENDPFEHLPKAQWVFNSN